jgi:hypothetical protein
MQYKNKKNKIFLIGIIYLTFLLFLFFDLKFGIKAQQQGSANVLYPFFYSDNENIILEKSGILGFGRQNTLSLGDRTYGGLIKFSSDQNFLALGFEPNNKNYPLWYSNGLNFNQYLNLWKFNSESNNYYYLGPVFINSKVDSTLNPTLAIGLVNNAFTLTNPSKSLYFYLGSQNNAAIVSNMKVDGDYFSILSATNWNWDFIEKNSPAFGIFFDTAREAGISLLGIRRERGVGIPLNSQWNTILRVSPSGISQIGGESVQANYVFTHPMSIQRREGCIEISSISTSTFMKDFFIDINIDNLNSRPVYIFSKGKEYEPGSKKCFYKNENYYEYTYAQYNPPIDSVTIVKNLVLLNPYIMKMEEKFAKDFADIASKTKTVLDPYDNSNINRDMRGGNCDQNPDDTCVEMYVMTTTKGVYKDVYLVGKSGKYNNYMNSGQVLCPNGYFATGFIITPVYNTEAHRIGLSCGRL